MQCNPVLTTLQEILTHKLTGCKLPYMTPKDIIQHYGNGSVPEAAIKLGLTRQTLHIWLRSEWVPLDWQHWIERDTAGRFKADPRRPNDPLIRKNKVTQPTVAT